MITDFDAVGPDVLHGTGTHTARNERKVFQPSPPLVEGVHDEVVPHLPRAHRDFHMAAVVGAHVNTENLDAEHQGLHVAVQQHVASSPQHEHLHAVRPRPIQRSPKPIHGGDVRKPTRFGFDAKRGVRRQFHMLKHVQGDGGRFHVAISLVPLGLKRSAVDSFPRPVVGNHVEDPLTLGPCCGEDVVTEGLGSQRGALPKPIRPLNGVHILRS